MHQPIPEQGQWLGQVVSGYFAYHAVPTNCPALSAFRHHVTDLWRRTLRRRSQKDRMTWERIAKLADDWLPQAEHPSSLAAACASPSHTRGGSRMREFRTYGSVRGAVGNARPYRERVSPVHTAVRNCTRDEGGPFEFGNQVLISSHRKLLWSKAMVVSVAEKSGRDPGRYD